MKGAWLAVSDLKVLFLPPLAFAVVYLSCQAWNYVRLRSGHPRCVGAFESVLSAYEPRAKAILALSDFAQDVEDRDVQRYRKATRRGCSLILEHFRARKLAPLSQAKMAELAMSMKLVEDNFGNLLFHIEHGCYEARKEFFRGAGVSLREKYSLAIREPVVVYDKVSKSYNDVVETHIGRLLIKKFWPMPEFDYGFVYNFRKD